MGSWCMQNEVTVLDLIVNIFFKWLKGEYQLCSGHRGAQREDVQPDTWHCLEIWGWGSAFPRTRLVEDSLTLNVLLCPA